MQNAILVGKGAAADSPQQWLLAQYGNRHGLIAGATGTGKTVTLQSLCEGFSDLGVPVFAADIKGDLSGLALAGGGKPKLIERAQQIGLENYAPQNYPVVFWDVFGAQGHPLRGTISDLGPLLLARLLNLSDVQEAVLQLVFKYCDDNGLLLLDLKDLKAALAFVASNAKTLGTDYGLISSASIGAIQRALVTLTADGAEHFFGEPALDLDDLMRQDLSGRGIINILAADQLYQKPALYSTFLLWLLAELFERLPEAGDLEQPKLVFFFDEAHLLFKDAPKALVDKVEQVVRLIRSKGVGVYFVTQNPLDLPDSVLGQLGNRVQHALRAFTPRDQKAVKAAAETFRANPKLDVEAVIGQLGVGEALVSCLGEGGIPGIVDRTLIRPPRSRIGAITPDERKTIRSRSPVGSKYDAAIDRESAYERLSQRNTPAPATAETPDPQPSAGEAAGWWQRGSQQPAEPTKQQRPPAARGGNNRQSTLEVAVNSVVRSVGSQLGREVGRQLLRGLLGSLSRR